MWRPREDSPRGCRAVPSPCPASKGSTKSLASSIAAGWEREEGERQLELAYNPFTLVFRNGMVEGEYLAEVSGSR